MNKLKLMKEIKFIFLPAENNTITEIQKSLVRNKYVINQEYTVNNRYLNMIRNPNKNLKT